jgi:uncharacterized protein (TIGR03083 family)
MQPLLPVSTAHLFRPLHDQLIALLRGLGPDDWTKPTVCKGWAVRDIASHLLDVEIRRLSFSRDGYDPPRPESPITSNSDLVQFLNRLNADWITASRRISPGVLVDLLTLTGPLVAAHFESLDMNAPARFPVGWAGEAVSANWFDVGREYTEWWHHQQQIRDAVGAPPLTSRYWLHPALDVFIRVLPHTYRDTSANPGETVQFVITGEAGDNWALVRRDRDWQLFAGTAPDPVCHITMNQDSAWRLFTKGLSPDEAARRIGIEGAGHLGIPCLRALAVMA